MAEIALVELRLSKIKWLLTNKFIKSYRQVYLFFVLLNFVYSL